MTRSDELTRNVMMMFWRGTISALDARKNLMELYTDNKITFTDYKNAINKLP